MKTTPLPQTPIERLIVWVGSTPSLVVHTIMFVFFFALAFSGELAWSLMLLVLTTIVSLEAIYLAIFIQMTVNRHSQSLREVEADVDEIQEDIDEIQEDVEEMSEDLEELSEDEQEELRKRTQARTLEALTRDMQKLLFDLEQLKKGR